MHKENAEILEEAQQQTADVSTQQTEPLQTADTTQQQNTEQNVTQQQNTEQAGILKMNHFLQCLWRRAIL